MPDARLTLAEARASCRCRLCGEPVAAAGLPDGWQDVNRELVHPVWVVLDYGREFAHGPCLDAAKAGPAEAKPAEAPQPQGGATEGEA